MAYQCGFNSYFSDSLWVEYFFMYLVAICVSSFENYFITQVVDEFDFYCFFIFLIFVMYIYLHIIYSRY